MYYLTFIKWGWLKQRPGIMTRKKGASCCVPPPPPPLSPSHPFPPAPQHLSIHPCLLTSDVNLGSFLWPTSHCYEKISAGVNSQNVAVKFCDLLPSTYTLWRRTSNGNPNLLEMYLSSSLPCSHWWKYTRTCIHSCLLTHILTVQAFSAAEMYPSSTTVNALWYLVFFETTEDEMVK